MVASLLKRSAAETPGLRCQGASQTSPPTNLLYSLQRALELAAESPGSEPQSASDAG
ncbi:MAG: hypothetical protein JWQ59_2268 [Cryobacterium sp.]|jgi:hypothetical protein|nr:hypothetical protein [Cryobacterium sp.]